MKARGGGDTHEKCEEEGGKHVCEFRAEQHANRRIHLAPRLEALFFLARNGFLFLFFSARNLSLVKTCKEFSTRGVSMATLITKMIETYGDPEELPPSMIESSSEMKTLQQSDDRDIGRVKLAAKPKEKYR